MGRRGPPPRSLVRLRYLLLKDPAASNRELAEELGVKVETIRQYKHRLSKKLVDVDKFCPECMEKTVIFDREHGEYVCTKCGLVVERVMNLSENLPWDTTYALTSNIAFGKSLGDTLPRRYLHRVIAKSPADVKDLPVRSTQIQIVNSAVDPPIVRRMLSYGSRLLRGLGMDRDTELCHTFADRYGRLLRKLAAFLQVAKLKVQPHMVARAALYHQLKETGLNKKADEAKRKFPFNMDKHLKVVQLLSQLE